MQSQIRIENKRVVANAPSGTVTQAANMNALERQAKATKHGRQIKAERTKFELLQSIYDLPDDAFSALGPRGALWDKLQLAFNHGYSAGYQDGTTPDPLYNHKGKQIREVTQAELDWTH